MYPLGRTPVILLSLLLAFFLWTPVEKAVGDGNPRISVEQARQLQKTGHRLTRVISCNCRFRSRTIDLVFSESSVYQLDGTEAEIEKLISDLDAMGEKFDVYAACSQ
jgi:hypothetical protein